MITISRRYAVSFLALGKRSLPMAIMIIYIGFVTFALFNYRMHCIFTEPTTLIKYHLLEKEEADKLCKIPWDNLGVEDVDIFHEHDLITIQNQNPLVVKGGEGKPEGCTSYQKVAIIVPYRNRYFHLKLLLSRLHPLLRKQKIHYRIFVIEQATNDSFNRGKLMNVGFKEALKEDHYDCFIFHDVDMIPENNKNLYLCDDHARHLSSAIDEMRYHVMYYNYAGGVIAMKRDVFKVINGYANSYWGWGNEDDDLSARIQEAGYLLTRPPEHIGRYKMVRHKKESRAENGYERFLGWRGRWLQDGLHSPKTMTYNVLRKSVEPLYTNITVDLLYDKNKEINVAEDTTKESLWCVMYYNYAGGVIAMKRDVFKVINGYANSYWGWGNEDDDLSARIQEAGYLLTRPPEHIGRYKMVRHKKESRAENGYERFLGWRGRWLQDGLHSPKTMTYNVLRKSVEPLYTNITVDLLYDKNKEINVAEDTTKESLWWFLKFYFP